MSLRNLCVFTFITYFSIAAIASPSRASDQLVLNGTAIHTSLQLDYYYAALFSELPSNDPQTLLWQENQRMEMTILVEEWSKRRFTQHLGQAIAINNTADNQEHNAKDIASFNTLIKDYLIRGDRIVIAKDIDSGTSISVNGITLMQTESHDFFTLFLNTWIGARPPSSTFKSSILGQHPTIDSSMMASYESLSASANRIEEIKTWHKKEKTKRKTVASKKSDSVKSAKKTTVAAALPTAKKVEYAIIETQPQYVDTEETIETEDIDFSIATDTSFSFDDDTDVATASVNEAEENSQSPQLSSNIATDEKSTNAVAANMKNKRSEEVLLTLKEKEAKQDLLRFYRSTILTTTYKKIVYPSKAIDKNQQGKVVIKVIVNRDGKVKTFNIKEKSKFKLLNQAANKAVAKAHYPRVPNELEGDEFEFILPIKFSLN